MFDQQRNIQNAILKKRARIEEINLIVAQAIPNGATTNSRRKLIEERLHLEQAVFELEREVTRIESPTAGLLKLPESLRSAGDPVGDNPFSVGDPRHKVWDEATLNAQEKWCRFNSEGLKLDPSSVDSLVDSVCSHFARKFDIWAERSVTIVWSDGAVRDYDQWLVNYAEGWLRDVSGLYSDMENLAAFLSELKLVLICRVEWWKAEARRYVAAQRAERPKENPATINSGPKLSPKSKPAVVGAELKLGNAAKFPVMTVREVTILLRVSRASVYRYLAEGRLNRPGLNKKPGKRSKTLILTTSVEKMLQEAED